MARGTKSGSIGGDAHLSEVIEGAASSQVAVEQVVQVADAPCLPPPCHLGQPPTPRLHPQASGSHTSTTSLYHE